MQGKDIDRQCEGEDEGEGEGEGEGKEEGDGAYLVNNYITLQYHNCTIPLLAIHY